MVRRGIVVPEYEEVSEKSDSKDYQTGDLPESPMTEEAQPKP